MTFSFRAQTLSCVVLFGLSYFFLTSAVGIGKVFIGTSENDTTVLFSFNRVVGGELPVFVLLFDNVTGEIIPGFTSATLFINCATVGSKGGYSNATFGVASFNPSQTTSTVVSISSLIAGRPVGVECWGSVHPQFNPETSLSPAKLFQVTPTATVSIVDGVIPVRNDGINTRSSFFIELSEPVQTYNVTVNCFVDTTGLTCPIQAIIESATIATQRHEMFFTVPVTSSCQRQPTPVFCRGKSQNGGLQFDNSTSEGARGLFILDQGQAILKPQGTSIYGTELQAVLSINSSDTREVIFFCTTQVVSTTAAGQAIANDGTCPIPITPTTPSPSTSDFPTDGETTDANSNTATEPSVSMTTNAVVTTDPAVSTDNTDTAAPTSVTSTTTASTISPTFNQTGTWFVEPSQIRFFGSTPTTTTQSQPLIISRTSTSLIAGTELVLVKCCAPPQYNSDPRYINQTSSLLVATYLSANLPINYTASTPNDQLETETVIINPAYVEVSPCPCNLTASACDVNCCCDSDCSAADVLTFTCLAGVEGGYANETIDEHLCIARPHPQPDWFSIMCIQIENSAFLGYYTYPRSAIRQSTDYTSNSTAYQPAYTYKDVSRSVTEGSSGYQTGVSVKTGIAKESDIADYYVGPNLRMGLPQHTAGGYCVWPAPVRFLTETSSSCVYSASLVDMCSTFVSPLNARLYAQSSRWTGATGPQVLTEQGVATLAYADVNYLCAGSALTGYTKSLETYADIVSRNEAVVFNVTIDNTTNCYFDPNTGAYLCGNQSLIGNLAATTTPPSRCPGDNGYTMPPSPVYNATSGFCQNAVVDVFYNFTWRGQSIVALNTTLILGNIPLVTTHTHASGNTTTAATIVTPRYRATFTYVSASNTSSEISINATTPSTAPVRARSGNPGYTDNLPVHSGVLASLSANDSSQVYVNTSDLSRLAVWIPGADGLCTNAQRGIVRFRQDTVTQCAVLLNIDAMSDCYNLRRQVLNQQDRMMPSNYIAVFGDPDVTLIANLTTSTPHWLPIFRQDVSYLFPSNASSNQSDVTTRLPVTTGLPVTTASSVTGIPETNQTVEGPAYITVAPGRCTDIPSGIHVDILYALAGTSNWGVILEIVGAKISYTTSTWSLKCASGIASSSCSSASPNASQPFYLTTSVNFIQVPASLPTGISRYDSERQNMSGVCQYDRCWSQLFYPFLPEFPGGSYDITLAYSLSFLLVLISLFLITRPWW